MNKGILKKGSKGSMFQPAMFTYPRTSKSHYYLILCLCLYVYVLGVSFVPLKQPIFSIWKDGIPKKNPTEKTGPCQKSFPPIPRKVFFRTISRWVWMPTWHLESLGSSFPRGWNGFFEPKYGKHLEEKKIDAVDLWKKTCMFCNRWSLKNNINTV